MRLLDTQTGQFVEKDPRNSETVYAILSHTWDKVEQTYQELRDIQRRYDPGCPPRPPPSSAKRRQNRTSRSPSSINTARSVKTTTTMGKQDMFSSPSPCPLYSRPSAPGSSQQRTHAVSLSRSFPPDSSSELSRIWEDPDLSPKIREACKVAREDGHRYIWIDSCCIDKTSSSELSEAINSMYQWYSGAAMCFAFLADVPYDADHEAKDSEFRRSRWFTRGWTLQELIAPLQVVFLSMTWTPIGSKDSFAHLVYDITNISDTALLHIAPLDTFSVAQRLSWAAMRETTRLEDQAYSLLGIFDINMPTLYGEGHRAFRRLQEEILRRIPDQTLFSWTTPHGAVPEDLQTARRELNNPKRKFDCGSLLSPSPKYFKHCGRIKPISSEEVVRRLSLWRPLRLPTADYYCTPHGIRTHFPEIPLCLYSLISRRVIHLSGHHLHLVLLQCEDENLPGYLLARLCCTPVSYKTSNVQPLLNPSFPDYRGQFEPLLLSPEVLKRLRWHLHPVDVKTFYIPHGYGRNTGTSLSHRNVSHKSINLIMLKATSDALYAHGYSTKLRGPDNEHPRTYWLTLSNSAHTITIEYQYTFRITLDGDQQLIVQAYWRVETSEPPLGINRPHNPGEAIRGHSGTLSWSDSQPWDSALSFSQGSGPQSIELPADILGTEGWRMDLKITFGRQNYYILHAEIRNERSKGTLIPAGLRSSMGACEEWARNWATRTVSRVMRTGESIDPVIIVELEDQSQGGAGV